jgi:hypothetical protein
MSMSDKYKYDFINSVKGKPFYVFMDGQYYNEPEEASGDSRGSYYYVGDIKSDTEVEILWNVGFRLRSTDNFSVEQVYQNFMEGNWVLVDQDLNNLFQDLH